MGSCHSCYTDKDDENNLRLISTKSIEPVSECELPGNPPNKFLATAPASEATTADDDCETSTINELGSPEAESDPNLELSEVDPIQENNVIDPLIETVDSSDKSPLRFVDLDVEAREKVDDLLRNHYIFEAHNICPSHVEEMGYMNTYRETVELLCGNSGQKWEKTLEGDLGDGDTWTLQYCWDGATPGSGGNEYLWVKLGIDEGIEWSKQLAAFHEADLDAKANPLVSNAWMISNEPTSAIRCNINGLFGKMFGYTQDYVKVRRFINKETGFCIESNCSVDHEELEKQGYEVGKKEYKKGSDMLLYVVSFPRTEFKSTAVLYTRLKLHLPQWLVNRVVSTIGPKLARTMIPKMIEQQKNDPAYQARYAEDRQGLYAYFKDFAEKGTALAQERDAKYSASNLPPSSVVLGRFAKP